VTRQVRPFDVKVLRVGQSFGLEHTAMDQQELVPSRGEVLDDGPPDETGAP
jgi:hypothetical protein